MRVYRCISTREITNIYKHNNVRKAPMFGSNTYQYEIGKEYVHFFRYYESAEYYKKRSEKEKNHLDKYVLIMTANIPAQILKNNLGYGFYSSVNKRIKGHIFPVPEYRIESSLFKSEYVVELNDSASFEYRNKKKEYEDYIELINELGEEYHYDYSKVVEYLSENDLDQLLGITERDLPKHQIENNGIGQIVKQLK